MIAILVAAALAADAAPSLPEPLNLNLLCQGQYKTVETSVGNTRVYAEGEWHNKSVTTSTPVMRDGWAKVNLHGDVGTLTYPDGKKRALSAITADARTITAEYERSMLVLHATWRLEINRLTGEVLVASGHAVAFRGMCSPEPTQPKF